MIRIRIFPLLAGALLFGLAASAVAQADAAKANSARTFMQQAAGAGVAEIQMGQLALTKSDNDDVKALAQRIVDDHTQANAQLKAIADRGRVALAAQPDAEAQRQAVRLRALDGSAFDQAWARAMVDDHEKALKLFRTEATRPADGDLRDFASATVPTLEAHLQAAQKLTALPSARDQAMKDALSTGAAPPAHQSPTKPATSADTPLNAPPSSLPATSASSPRPAR